MVVLSHHLRQKCSATNSLSFLLLTWMISSCGLFSSSSPKTAAGDTSQTMQWLNAPERSKVVELSYHSLANDVAQLDLYLYKDASLALVIRPLTADEKKTDSTTSVLRGQWSRQEGRIVLEFNEEVSAYLLQGTQGRQRLGPRRWSYPAEADHLWIFGVRCERNLRDDG